MATLRIGDPLDKNTDVRAISSRCNSRGSSSSWRQERRRAERYSAPCPLPAKGYWFAPTFFTGVAQSSRIAREEIFGPVLSILTFRTPEEAIEKANSTMYGLSAGIWTDKGAKIFWMAQRLKAGVIWGNTYSKFDASSPFEWLQGERLRARGRAAGLARRTRRSREQQQQAQHDDGDACERARQAHRMALGDDEPRDRAA